MVTIADRKNFCKALPIKHSFWLPSRCCFGPDVAGGKAPKEVPKVAAAWLTVAGCVELVVTGHGQISCVKIDHNQVVGL